jgi:hypothetical protein
VSGTAINYVGQIALFDMRDSSSACYSCFVPQDIPVVQDQSSSSGVLAPSTGTIGSMQTTKVLHLFISGRSHLNSWVLLYDARDAEWSYLPKPLGNFRESMADDLWKRLETSRSIRLHLIWCSLARLSIESISERALENAHFDFNHRLE